MVRMRPHKEVVECVLNSSRIFPFSTISFSLFCFLVEASELVQLLLGQEEVYKNTTLRTIVYLL